MMYRTHAIQNKTTVSLVLEAVSLKKERAAAAQNSHLPPSYTKLLEKAMAPHSSTLAWKIPWMEEPGRL